MGYTLDNRLVIGTTSMALFDLREADQVFQEKRASAYTKYQLAHENEILSPGAAFPLIKAFENLNYRAKTVLPIAPTPLVEVVLMSRNSPDAGLRIFNSIQHHKLNISRAAFTSGRPITPYLKAFNIDLFLTASKDDVESAISNGFAAGLLYPMDNASCPSAHELRVAFDGDAVLFSAESETRYQTDGPEAFHEFETKHAHVPLEEGPFAKLLRSIAAIQRLFRIAKARSPIRTALVTSRNAPSHKRPILTLRHWDVNVDEAFFLGGVEKDAVLRAFQPHIFFDDQHSHCELASKVVPTARVPIPKQSQRVVEAKGVHSARQAKTFEDLLPPIAAGVAPSNLEPPRSVSDTLFH